MVEKRFVTINPEFFKLPSTNTTRKKKATGGEEKPEIKFKEPKTQKERTSKTIKKNLLNYIRKQQQKNYDDLVKNRTPREPVLPKQPDHIVSSDFKDSLDYLMKLTKENERKHHHNQTIRNPISAPIQNTGRFNPHHGSLNHSANSIPSKGRDQKGTVGSLYTNENVSLALPIEFINMPTENSPPVHINPPKTYFPPPPQYGCLKNGSLPTYRSWKNQTQKNYGPSISCFDNSSTSVTGGDIKEKLFKEKVEELKRLSKINSLASSPNFLNKSKITREQFITGNKIEKNKNVFKKNIPKRQKTYRRTYRVGKSKVAPKISVLVSNKTIRKNIYTQALLLKQTPIKEVKRYLIKHGFIRVGSIAPNDILRRMYENAKLVCGELKNHNPDNLLYNFLNDDTNK
jgi:hypothetical protein